jgi:hypothetical protein
MCDDNIDCTIDTCDYDLGICTNILNNTFCDDGIPCTEDLCSIINGGCIHNERDFLCDDKLECTNDYCLPSHSGADSDGCVGFTNDTLCDDGVDCTLDYCDPLLGCINLAQNYLCNDNISCTGDVCSPLLGCINSPYDILCSDGIECTVDKCDSVVGCTISYDNTICDDGIACTNDICSPNATSADLCIHETQDSLCDDGRSCSTEYCSATDGCVLISDADCPLNEREFCIDCASEGSRVTRVRMSDGSSDMYIKTRNAAVGFGTVGSATQDLTTNFIIKGSNGRFSGEEESIVIDEDGLSVGQDFKIVPSDSLTSCNELKRGAMKVITTFDGVNDIDQLWVCLRTLSGYEWQTFSTSLDSSSA